MKLVLENNEIEIKMMTHFIERLKGNMGKKKIDKVLCFPKCNSIHTFFMKVNIDVIMTDKDYNILYIFPDLKKNRIILPKKNVYYVYELPNNSNRYRLGEKIKLTS